LIFVFLGVFCVGPDIGVPFFCILLGFPTGWYAARRAIALTLAGDVKGMLCKALVYADHHLGIYVRVDGRPFGFWKPEGSLIARSRLTRIAR